jgi:uncharacterized protein (DUF1330 family)
MSVYFMANVKVTDDAWVPGYAAIVHDIAARHGGKYLSRSGKIETLNGVAPDLTLIAIVEFPSREAFQSFLDDPEYKPHLDARYAGSESLDIVIDDTDLAGAIPYLTAAE